MFTDYLTFLVPALLGAQCVLTLVLTKGEICPGQRGRVHKTLPVILAGWLLVVVSHPVALLPLLALSYFTFQVKTGKTRDAGPLKVLYAAGVFATVSWLGLLPAMQLPEMMLSLMAIPLFGASLAHLLLTQARTRLQAFHRILPFTGFVSAMVSILAILWLLSGMDEAQLELLVSDVVGALLLLVLSLLVWAGHILLGKTVNRWQLLAASILLVASGSMQLAFL
ncbi:hypothetical protein [Photobacterium atrarenae]|uniref:Uncharacterized protein n=1 Tax=Photobacterium atrarenae TaxID=865757 RepID=A0ABY5GBU1_9GAMM|nr:hypothetical protein [Photobacterium atrarenae]UTV26661.1 hypothetical protein NNL38_09825 [Photobacterium atrarenae]